MAASLMAYTLSAPPWRPPLRHNSAGDDGLSGFPELHDTHPGQEEDLLPESVVQRGFTGKTIVQSETFSAHSMICDKLQANDVIPELSRLVVNVEAARASLVSSVGPNTYKLPQRSHLNDQKREAWVAELVNPDVPLTKVAKAIVPHGYKGEKMLELLTTKRIPIARAVWFIRVCGNSDISAAKGRIGFTTAGYTDEWTSTACEYTRKLLAEIVLPTMPSARPGMSVKGKVKATLSDVNLRQQWGSRFGFLTMLLRRLFCEGLLAPAKFLEWQVGQLKTAHFGQLPFVLHIVEEYLDEHLDSGILSSALVEHCLQRLKEIANDQLNPILRGVRYALERVLQTSIVRQPSLFVAPRLWVAYAEELYQLAECEGSRLADDDEQALHEEVKDQLEDCQRRATYLLCLSEPSTSASTGSTTLRLIQILDGIRFPCELLQQYEAFFESDSTSLKHRVDVLLTWASNASRPSSAKPFVVCQLLRIRHQRHQLDLNNLQDVLTAWLDDASGETSDVESILRTMAELAAADLFSYPRYLRNMIARGETDARSQRKPSLHQRVLRYLPASEIASSTALQRRASSRVSSTPVACHSRELQEKLDRVLVEGAAEDVVDLIDRLQTIGNDDERAKLAGHLETYATDSAESMTPEKWALLVACLEALSAYKVLAQVCHHALLSATSRSLVLAVADVISIHLDVWVAVDAVDDLARTLLAAYSLLRPLAAWPISVTDLLIELDVAGQCSGDIARALQHALPDPVIMAEQATPEVLPELVAELNAMSSESDCATLAQLLCTRYGTAQWSWLGQLITTLTASLDDGMRSNGLVERYAWLLSALHERPRAHVGERLVNYLCERDSAVTASLQSLVALLVVRNVVTLPCLVSIYLRPLLSASFDSCRSREASVGETELAYIDSAAELLRSVLPSDIATPSDLALRARWRSLLTGEALLDLLRLGGLLALHEAVFGPETEQARSWRTARETFQRLPMVQEAFLRRTRDGTAAIMETASGLQDELRKHLLNELARWIGNLAHDDGSLGATTLEAWAAMPADKAIWHVDIIRVEMQIYLETQASVTGSSTAQDAFLQRLMLDSDPSLAEDLVQSFTSTATNRLIDVILSRLQEALVATAEDADSAWVRLKTLLGRLLVSTGSSTLQPLSVPPERLQALQSSLVASFEGTIAGSTTALERPLFALLVTLRCEGKVDLEPDKQDPLQLIVRGLVGHVQRLEELTCSPVKLVQRLCDVLAFLCDVCGNDIRLALRDALPSTCGAPSLAHLAWLVQPGRRPGLEMPLLLSPTPLTPWDLIEVAPLYGTNTTAIDLDRFGAHLLASGPRASRLIGPEQARFDSEWPTERETATMRDYRRNVAPSMVTEAARQVAPPSMPAPKEVVDLDDDEGASQVPGKRKADSTGKQGPPTEAAKTVATGKAKARKSK